MEIKGDRRIKVRKVNVDLVLTFPLQIAPVSAIIERRGAKEAVLYIAQRKFLPGADGFDRILLLLYLDSQ